MKHFLILGALAMALAVMLGAFGAHGLKARVSADALSAWQTGVQYHMIHALALLMVALLMAQFPAMPGLHWIGGLFLAGILLFSGSLYLLVLTGWRFLGPITPIGGVAFSLGWLGLLWSAWRL